MKNQNFASYQDVIEDALSKPEMVEWLAEAKKNEPPKKTCAFCSLPMENKFVDGNAALIYKSQTMPPWSSVEHEGCTQLYDRADKLGAAARDALRDSETTRWSHVPVERFEDYEIKNKTQAGAKIACQSLRYFDSGGILLTGPAGVGKSHLAKATVARLVFEQKKLIQECFESPEKHARTVERRDLEAPSFYCETASVLLQKCREVFKPIPQIMSARIALIDDIGAENATDWTRDILFQILEHRTNRRMLTIITTNLTLDDLRERFHERIASRIVGSCVVLKIEGGDHRALQGEAFRRKLLSRVGAVSSASAKTDSEGPNQPERSAGDGLA